MIIFSINITTCLGWVKVGISQCKARVRKKKRNYRNNGKRFRTYRTRTQRIKRNHK